MTFEELVKKYPKLTFLKYSSKFSSLNNQEKQFAIDMIEDAMFWVELESQPHAGDGFKFLTATYGLENARIEADKKGLQGKDREKFLRPHQDLYTMFNPYSGNGREVQ